MSKSRFKNSQSQERDFQGQKNRNREQQTYPGEHSGQQFNREIENQRERNRQRDQDSSNHGEQDSGEQERYGGQGGYGGSQGVYGRQGGYQQNNYPQGIHEESDFSFGSEYIQDARAHRPSRLSRQTGNRSWVGVGESSNSGDLGGRSYSSNEYNENPSYREETSGREYGGPNDDSRFGNRGLQRHDGFGGPGSGQTYGQFPPSLPSSRPSFAGRGPQGYKRSDERITEDINEHLTQDHGVDASDITVESKDGEVVLKGTVTDREAKRRAEEIAESCSGVKDVQNQLRIKRPDSRESSYDPNRYNNSANMANTDDKRSKAG